MASLIHELGLAPHPEGGTYREVYRSARRVETPRGPRSQATAICFLLGEGEFSRWHRVANPEWWHLHDGGPVELTWLTADGLGVEGRVLARPGALDGRERGESTPSPGSGPICVVPAGRWQSARSLGEWSLVGCTVSPGFEFDDFALMHDRPEAADLKRHHPALADAL